MKSECKVGEHGEVIIPALMRAELGLDVNTSIEIELEGSLITLRAKRAAANFDLAVERFAGSLRRQFLADGYSSVDEYVAESRGR